MAQSQTLGKDNTKEKKIVKKFKRVYRSSISASLIQEMNNEIFWLINDLANGVVRFLFHR